MPQAKIKTDDIVNSQITLDKMADIANNRLVGRATSGTGVPEAITIGSGLTLTGTTLSASGGGGGGGITRSINNVATNTTAGSTALIDYIYFVSGTTTITLPTAVGNSNRYTIKNVGTGIVTIATTSSQTIDDGTAPITITSNNNSLDLVSNNANWKLIGN